MLLGRKFEVLPTVGEATEANLDEKDQQKYDRRWSDLLSAFVAGIGLIGCNYGYTVQPGDIGFEKNLFDTNIDFVGGEIIFSLL
jgi:hypothetical protein